MSNDKDYFPIGTRVRYNGHNSEYIGFLSVKPGDILTVKSWAEYEVYPGWWGFVSEELAPMVVSLRDNTKPVTSDEIISQDYSSRAVMWEKVDG